MRFKRHEFKYYLNEAQTASLAQKLRHVLEIDEHSISPDGYWVRSLYFDSFDDECLFQKQSGFQERMKIRLRTYGDAGSDTVKFEIKHKHGQLILKQSADIARDDARNISAGNYKLLLEYGDPLLDRIYAIFSARTYSPKVIVEYMRRAYVFPDKSARPSRSLVIRV